MMIAVVGTALLGFAPLMMWLASRQKESEARYHLEMARRIAEAADPQPVLDYVRKIEQKEAARARLTARVAGLITAAVGLALMIFLSQLQTQAPVYLVGLIPLLIGGALLLASQFMMKQGE
ncbi:MAG: hypothetical protein AB7E72_06790 [Lysobacterales bacterium]